MTTIPPGLQEYLLGRGVQDVLTAEDRAELAGQAVLVTGAGGSVGAELIRQLAACGPSRLVLFEQSEYALFRIESAVRQHFPDVRIDVVLGDVTRQSDIRAACRRAHPRAVYHAAAYKHVVLTETAIVPAVRTNVLGTLETVKAAREVGARFVLISSDKAAEPGNVMGATKRLAELVALSCATPLFRPLAVRFGNILGSSGSLLEIMCRSAEEGRDIPVTDPDATRYFMTASEAGQLVLKSDLIGRAGEVLWLDMGVPVRIGDLVGRFLDWSVAAGRPAVGITTIGLRPGEKRTETLTTQGLSMRKTVDPRIWSARQSKAVIDVEGILRRLRRAVARGDAAQALLALQESVPGFAVSDAARTAALSGLMPSARGHLRAAGA
jgi:FlaA1/EpsC-like NDP-sugar epimerase